MNAQQTPGERSGSRVGRRQFLVGAAAAAAAVATGCSEDSDGSGGTATTSPARRSTTTRRAARLAADPFTLGVASGDPLVDRVILWTRLAPDPLAEDGAGAMPSDTVDVTWEVAADARFAKRITSGVAAATVDRAHTVHIDATGLEPGTDYHYRFRVGEWTSPIGRTRTLPEGSPSRFGLAVVNCQWYETGTYAAYRHLLDEDIDLVAHLGDYIYEMPGGSGNGRNSLPDREVETLADYRLRYASYKVDPDLMAAHARFPFFVTWDDHEVANNIMGDTLPGPPVATAEVQERKAAAYRAWWEHLPVRLPEPEGGDLAVHRAIDIGDLARLYLLDERQDSAVPPCRDGSVGELDFGDCPERTGEDRTRLGTDQEAWLAKSLGRGGVTWNLLGNPVVLAGIDAGTDTSEFYLDTWDGFPDARTRLIAQLADVENPVVLTGDYHAGMVLDVHAVPFDEASPVVCTEFMAPPISSVLFPGDVSARTPQLREQLNHHGYLAVDVTPDRLTARFRVLGDVGQADTAITTASTWTVQAGDPRATRA